MKSGINSSSSYFFILCIIFMLPPNIISLNDANDLLLNAEEKVALEKTKSLVMDLLQENFMKSDYYLIRWIRAANLDLSRTQTLLKNNVKWRQMNNISEILFEDWSDMEEDFPISYEGHDKDGRPLMLLNFGDWDIRSAVIQGKMRRLQRYLTQSLERTMQNIFKAQMSFQGEKIATRATILVDVTGFNAAIHACIQCLAALTNWAIELDSYYPCFIDEVIIINAPPLAVVSLNSIRPFMSEDLRNLLKVFNSNKLKWMEYLDERIDRRERSVRYGGTK